MSEQQVGYGVVGRLQEARAGDSRAPLLGVDENAEGQAMAVFREGFRAGRRSRGQEILERQEAAREAGFDAAVNEMLRWMLLELQGVAGELSARRGPKVMADAALKRIDGMLRQIEQTAAAFAPDEHGFGDAGHGPAQERIPF